ncbi:hypothetical protein ACS0TY_010903 [Phlomoides rotata]
MYFYLLGRGKEKDGHKLTFRESRYYKDKKASAVLAVVLDSKFWSDWAIVVGDVAPLISVLRIMDTNWRPSIGYVYDGIYRAKKAIKDVFRHKRRLYKPFTYIQCSKNASR